MSLADVMVAELALRFASRGVRVEANAGPRIVVPAVCAEVGDMVVEVDGDEAVVYVGRFTHCHFGNFDDGRRGTTRDEAIVAEVVELLELVFAERVVMWGSHTGGGGITGCDDPRSPSMEEQLHGFGVWPTAVFAWSGRVE